MTSSKSRDVLCPLDHDGFFLRCSPETLPRSKTPESSIPEDPFDSAFPIKGIHHDRW